MEEFYKKVEADLESLAKNHNAICFAISQNDNLFTVSIYPQMRWVGINANDSIILLKNVKMSYIRHLMHSIFIKNNFIPIARTSNNFSIPNMPKVIIHRNMYFCCEYIHMRGHKNSIYHISLMKPEVIPTFVGNYEGHKRIGRCRIIFDKEAYQDFLKFLESSGRFDILLQMET